MLGHATIAITLDTYSHVLPNNAEGCGSSLGGDAALADCRTVAVEDPGYSPGPSFTGRVSSAKHYFFEWAMLGSNQRPRPCEGSTAFSLAF
jgi:hypothetical protein